MLFVKSDQTKLMDQLKNIFDWKYVFLGYIVFAL